MSDVVELSLLERALARLKEAVVKFKEPGSDEIVRDGLIQRFEFRARIEKHFVLVQQGGAPSESTGALQHEAART